MAKKALILSPSLGFAGLIRQVLEDTGDFEVSILGKLIQSGDLRRASNLTLVVLDADFVESGLAEVVKSLRYQSPDLSLIAIPAETRPTDPQLVELGADALLRSPFYLPDLVHAVEQLFGPLTTGDKSRRVAYGAPVIRKTAALQHPQASPDWLKDVSQAAQYLTRLTLESASQAALITRGEKVWAYAGALPKEAAEELADAISEHLSADRADLARFIHLEATKSDYMLYATGLGGEYGLALVFDAQMPFSQMRAQVDEIASALASAPQKELAENATVQAKTSLKSGILRLRVGEPNGEPAGEGPRSRGTVPSGNEPSSFRRATHTGSLKTTSASSYDLHYSFVLIPRLPTQMLVGDLSDKVAIWLPQLCLAFGWRFENISLQSEFLQWTISMGPNESPESVIETLGKYLSQRIFEEFPRMAKENPSGHFWAAGSLIVSGTQPGAELVTQYILQTRARQGIPNRS
jgi:REP element-mobilizing transposase RayT/CheY-like chemotaxis protein